MSWQPLVRGVVSIEVIYNSGFQFSIVTQEGLWIIFGRVAGRRLV